MATSNALIAMIMATRPNFRSKADRVAFAVHTSMVAQGFKLEAVGEHAEKASSAGAAESQNSVADFDNWNSSSDAYMFLYNPDPWQKGAIKAPVMLKGVVLGDQLLLNWVTLNSAQQEPQQLELDIDHYATSKTELPACYQNLDDLVSKLQSRIPLLHQPTEQTAQKASAGSSARTAAVNTRQEPPPDYGAPDDEFPQEPTRTAQRPAGMIGSHDAVPPGFQPPGYGGLQEPFPGGMGRSGGMHMGPDDPLFAGRGSMRPGRPGSHPSGARYDPIGPPGMPGFEPDDFQRRPGQIHPDMAQPGRGRGPDWDSMFG